MTAQPTEAAGILLGAAQSFLAGEHPSAGLGDIARAVVARGGAAAALVLYRPHRRGDLVLAGSHGLEDEARRRALLPLAREVGSWVERTRGPVEVSGGPDPRFPARDAAGCGAFRAAPLVCNGAVLGVLAAFAAAGDGGRLPEFDPLALTLAALGLRHWVWEEEARLARSRRDEAERLHLRAERAAGAFEAAADMARQIRGAARAAVRVTERLGPLEDEDLRTARELVTEQLARIDRVASQILEAEVTPGPRAEPCDLGDLVEAALDRVEPDLRDRRVRVTRRIGASVPILVLEADLVRRVLTGLLAAVGERVPAKGRLKVELARRGGTAEVWVAADGPREAGAVLDALWAPFLAQDPTRGFSVASAHDFLRDTGARIEARTEADWPQSYRVHLPIAGNRDRRGREDRRRRRERRA